VPSQEEPAWRQGALCIRSGSIPQPNGRIGRALTQCLAPCPFLEAALGDRHEIAGTASRTLWDKIPRSEILIYYIYVMRFPMTTTTPGNSNPSWRAEVKWERRYYRLEEEVPKDEIQETPQGETKGTPETQTVETIESVRECFVDVFKPGGERIRFRVNRREGRPLSFTDPREQFTGAGGTRGIWGTLPEQPAGSPRSLTPTAFREEVARLIGSDRSEEIVRSLRARQFFCSRQLSTRVRTATSPPTRRTAP